MTREIPLIQSQRWFESSLQEEQAAQSTLNRVSFMRTTN